MACFDNGPIVDLGDRRTKDICQGALPWQMFVPGQGNANRPQPLSFRRLPSDDQEEATTKDQPRQHE